MVCSWQEPEIQTLQDKLFYHFLTSNDCIKEKYPQALSHPSLSLSAWFTHSSTGIHREMALWLTPSWDPQQKKYRLVILQCIHCEISWYHASTQTCACHKANSERAVTAENHISGLCFTMAPTPHYNRDLWRAVSSRDLLGTINELPEEVAYIIWMYL